LTQPPPDRFESIAAALAARVEAIVGAAEREAAAVQVDLEAQRREAEAELRRYVAEARARVEAQAEQRVDRLRRLTDGIVTRAEESRAQLEELVSELRRATLELESERRVMSERFEATPPAPVAQRPPEEPDEPPYAEPLERHRPRSPSGAFMAPRSWQAPEPEPEPAPEPEPEPFRPERHVPRNPSSAAIPPPAWEPPEAKPEPQPEPEERREAAEGGASARVVAIQMAVAGASRGEVDIHLREHFGVADTAPILDDVFGESTDDSSRMSWG